MAEVATVSTRSISAESEDRLMADEQKVKGPASYFPSIEKKYGQPIDHWLELIRARPADEKHMETVAWLKSEYGIGHGHANAMVAYVRAEG